MKKYFSWLYTLILLATTIIFSSCVFAAGDNTLNVFNWSSYMPEEVIKQFVKETGIQIHYSTYDSNETLYAKLKTNRTAGYDIAFPSTYILDRMRKEHMLLPLDKSKLSNFKYLDPKLLNQSYDPSNQYSIPYLWGTTGLVINTHYFAKKNFKHWADLWDNQYRDQLMLLDDQREIFSIALKTLGYSINDTNPEHIHQAYLKLKQLMPNVKLFNTAAAQAVYIDEDALIGIGWSGDIYLVNKENPRVDYLYPEEGAIIWLDSLVIPNGAKHVENAYRFINFILRPDIAKKISQRIGFASPNLAAIKRLPKHIQENRIIYPNAQDMRHSEFQNDIGASAVLYQKYWERLKIEG